jgi:hypothetical protein
MKNSIKKSVVLMILACFMVTYLLSNITYANEKNSILSAVERINNIKELDKSLRIRDGWFIVATGVASFCFGLLFSNVGANSNSGGLNFGGGIVYAYGMLFEGVGGFAMLAGTSKVYLQKSETELDYEKIIKLNLDKREKSAREYLIMKDLQIKKYGLNGSFIFPDYKKLYLNEINEYLLDHHDEN